MENFGVPDFSGTFSSSATRSLFVFTLFFYTLFFILLLFKILIRRELRRFIIDIIDISLMLLINCPFLWSFPLLCIFDTPWWPLSSFYLLFSFLLMMSIQTMGSVIIYPVVMCNVLHKIINMIFQFIFIHFLANIIIDLIWIFLFPQLFDHYKSRTIYLPAFNTTFISFWIAILFKLIFDINIVVI